MKHKEETVAEYNTRLKSYLRKKIWEELEKYDGGFTDEWNDQRKKNAEVLGYKLAGKSDIKEAKSRLQSLKDWGKMSDRERSDKIDKYYPKKTRLASLKIWQKLSDRERSDNIVKVMNESINESRYNVKKAIKIAKKMGGNMTGAVKKIEKIQKGLSKQIEVEDALRKANESVNERMDKRQGTETLKQLGGNKFIAMTGAKDFGVGPKGMSFKIGRNSKRVNYIRIDLKNDLYNMEFMWVSKRGVKVVKKVKGVYNDQLQKVFTKYTGMYTRL